MLARGIFLLHARHGHLPFGPLVQKAEQLAQTGVPVSQALARDLALVYGPLSEDPGARAVFGSRDGALTQGQGLVQPALASILAQMRVSGVGDLYTGLLAHRIEENSPAAGVPIGLADLRTALPTAALPVVVSAGDDELAFPPSDGGLGAAAAFMALKSQPNDLQAALDRALAAAARWHLGGQNSDQVLNEALTAPAPALYPASTSFVTVDPEGDAVICALTMNNLFGTGRMVPGMGFLAGASPAGVTAPLLAVGLAWNEHQYALRAAVGASGQAGASLAAAVALTNTLRDRAPMSALVPDPGRANVVACPGYLPGSEKTCGAVADPRESGFATNGN
jgi:gamma-glutamyltranspeptidase/glutathione hydrolase